MRARTVVAVLIAALAVYFVLIGYRGVYLLSLPAWRFKLLGAAVLALPLVGIWVVVAEVRFGRATQRLAERLGDVPVPDLPRRPSGRVDRAAADATFADQRRRVEDAPQNWRQWFLLAEAYDAAGDRRRARAAMRTAIDLADSAGGTVAPPGDHSGG